MAATINVAGASPVYVDTGSAHALELLGYTADGCEIDFPGYFLDVPVDDHGGESGDPADVQYMGDTARIQLNLTKWDEAVADKIRPRLYGGSVGVVGTRGSLMIGGALTYRLLINSPTRPYNFPVVIFRDAHRINKGTKYSTWVNGGVAYPNASSVLYNATTS